MKKNGEKNSVDTIINTPFTQERRGTQHGEMLYIVDGPFQLVHADVANLEFSSKSVDAPKYCLLCVDLFTSKVHTYGMKKKASFKISSRNFRNIDEKREFLKNDNRHRMRSQTDQEFNQNEIKDLNKKLNVEHFNSRLNEGHALAAEQKIRELKKRL